MDRFHQYLTCSILPIDGSAAPGKQGLIRPRTRDDLTQRHLHVGDDPHPQVTVVQLGGPSQWPECCGGRAQGRGCHEVDGEAGGREAAPFGKSDVHGTEPTRTGWALPGNE